MVTADFRLGGDMSNKKKRVWASIGSSLLFVIAVAMLFVVYCVPKLDGIDSLNENNTTAYEATVDSVEKTKDGYCIKLEEYDIKIIVNAYLLDSEHQLENLQNGDKIVFRLLGAQLNLSEISGIEFVVWTLTINNIEVISLSKANEIHIHMLIRNKIITTIISIICIIVGVIICVVVFLKTRNNRKDEQTEKT